MKIVFVANFGSIAQDEEHVMYSLEAIGHDVIKIDQKSDFNLISRKILLTKPDLLLFFKWRFDSRGLDLMIKGREWGMKTACWLFDLYWGYERQHWIDTDNYFKADYLFTTDGGHDDMWRKKGIRHKCVRQGIYIEDCYMLSDRLNEGSIAFIGSDNPFYRERTVIMGILQSKYKGFNWYGRRDTNFIRDKELNKMFSRTKIIVGDSVYSPYYWSNRVVETLGRGGFLIHQEVEGIKEEYPDLVTYKRGDAKDLLSKIDYYLEHEDERMDIVHKNFNHVKDNYIMSMKCKELIEHLW
jgi:hypothetical protein